MKEDHTHQHETNLMLSNHDIGPLDLTTCEATLLANDLTQGRLAALVQAVRKCGDEQSESVPDAEDLLALYRAVKAFAGDFE